MAAVGKATNKWSTWHGVDTVVAVSAVQDARSIAGSIGRLTNVEIRSEGRHKNGKS